MKVQTIIIALITITLAISSCTKDQVSPSDHITKVTKHFDDYNKLDISGPFEVFVTYSEFEESIEIEANDNLHEYILVERNGNTLHIQMKNNTQILGSNEVLKAYVTTKYIDEYEAAGLSKIKLQTPAKTSTMEIRLSGLCTLQGEIETDKMISRLSGNSKLMVTGAANKLDANVTGASEIEHFDFEVNDVDLDLSGSSNASITANGEIKVKATGNSTFYYKGDGIVVKQTLTGNSTIEKVN